jgi:hypothetical protein
VKVEQSSLLQEWKLKSIDRFLAHLNKQSADTFHSRKTLVMKSTLSFNQGLCRNTSENCTQLSLLGQPLEQYKQFSRMSAISAFSVANPV